MPKSEEFNSRPEQAERTVSGSGEDISKINEAEEGAASEPAGQKQSETDVPSDRESSPESLKDEDLNEVSDRPGMQSIIADAPGKKSSADKTTQILTFGKSKEQEQKKSRNKKAAGKTPGRKKKTRKAADEKSSRKTASKPASSAQKIKKPRQKLRLTYKGWILVVALIGIVSVGLFAFFNQPSAIDRLSLTYLDNLNRENLAVTLQSTFADTYSISDYTYYGETLTLYHNRYQNGTLDELYGRNVMLRNLETGEQLTYTFAGGADSGIPAGELSPGVYEIYVYDGFTPKRVYTDEELHSDPLTTMRRNKEVTTINLDASKDYLSKFGITTDENYLYLTVTDSLPKVKIIDVMIDPSGMLKYDYLNEVDEGYTGPLFSEAVQSYSLALEIKSFLEEAGLRVEISRPEGAALGYNGVNSRTGAGYSSQAKVFLSLAMDGGDEAYPSILVSPYTNGLLANRISYVLQQNGIQLSPQPEVERLDEGVAFDTFQVSDEYEYMPYTLWPQLRETGGKTTYTGTAYGSEANENFSDSYGMYGLIFFYASQENQSSQEYYMNNKEVIARSVARGIVEYFQIPVDDPDTAAAEDSSSAG